MAKRKMGIRAAWLYLAKKWDTPEEGICHDGKSWGVRINEETGPSPGLCCCINDLRELGAISLVDCDAMHRHIRPNKSEDSAFVWPCDNEGAKKRAEFARKMAAKYAKKAKVKKMSKRKNDPGTVTSIVAGSQRDKAMSTLTIIVRYTEPGDMADIEEIVEKCREQGEIVQADYTIHKDQSFDLRYSR